MSRGRALASIVAAAVIGALAVPAAPVQAATPPAPPAFDHFFVIVMENHSYSDIIGSAAAPYINSLLPSAAVATNYTAVTHPSLPNYLALVAGSTFGITSDCTTCWLSAPSLADTLDSAGLSWKAYEESMPGPCFGGSSYPYAQKHDPFVYFNDIRLNAGRCQAHVVPYTELGIDLRTTSTTPAFGFITPNLCDDMHDCSVSTGDTWLKQHVPAILASPAFSTQRSVLAITWDESDTTSGNHVATLFLGGGAARGARSAVSYNHYSLLRTVESALGVGTVAAGDASASPMSDLLYGGCTPSVAVAASQSTTEFPLQLTTGACAASYFDVAQADTTLGGAWVSLAPARASGGAATSLADGYAGHAYEFVARTHLASGAVGPWSAVGSTAVSASATASHPWNGVYTLDEFGGVHPAESPPPGAPATWTWDAARAAAAMPGPGSPQAGLVLDAYGGLHPYGATLSVTSTAYWPGWDIARDVAFLPDGTGGYVLDAYGGLHPFAVDGAPLPPPAVGGPYWNGLEIARRLVVLPDGSGGYVLDGYGGVHPFGIGRAPAPAPTTTGYWGGWDIARDLVLLPGTGAGYVLDGFGGMHPFAPSGVALPPAAAGAPYWPGWPIARAAWMLPATPGAGYVLDGWGGLHPFGGAPALTVSGYTPGADVARAVFGA